MNSPNSYYIQIDGERFRSNTANTDQFFEKLKNSDTVHCYLRDKNGTATIKDIATVFNRKPNYFEREEAVRVIEQNKIQELKKELSQLKKEKQEISVQSLQTLIAKSKS
ncbi:NTPase, partial [Bacillus amyloliquefaciens]|nr:NTPase [Bacillus amyloliquefaciens]